MADKNFGEVAFESLAAGVGGVKQGLDQRRATEQQERSNKLQDFMAVMQFEQDQRQQTAQNLQAQRTEQLLAKGRDEAKLREGKMATLNTWNTLSKEKRDEFGDNIDAWLADMEHKRILQADIDFMAPGGGYSEIRDGLGQAESLKGITLPSGRQLTFDTPPTSTPKDPLATQRNAFIGLKSKELGHYESQIGLGGVEEKIWVQDAPTAKQIASWNREFDKEFGVEGRLPNLPLTDPAEEPLPNWIGEKAGTIGAPDERSVGEYTDEELKAIGY